MKKVCLGIEFGSTRIKAMAIDERHAPVSSGNYTWASSYENGVWTYSLDEVCRALRRPRPQRIQDKHYFRNMGQAPITVRIEVKNAVHWD